VDINIIIQNILIIVFNETITAKKYNIIQYYILMSKKSSRLPEIERPEIPVRTTPLKDVLGPPPVDKPSYRPFPLRRAYDMPLSSKPVGPLAGNSFGVFSEKLVPKTPHFAFDLKKEEEDKQFRNDMDKIYRSQPPRLKDPALEHVRPRYLDPEIPPRARARERERRRVRTLNDALALRRKDSLFLSRKSSPSERFSQSRQLDLSQGLAQNTANRLIKKSEHEKYVKERDEKIKRLKKGIYEPGDKVYNSIGRETKIGTVILHLEEDNAYSVKNTDDYHPHFVEAEYLESSELEDLEAEKESEEKEKERVKSMMSGKVKSKKSGGYLLNHSKYFNHCF